MAHKVEKQRQGIQSIEVGTRLFCATSQRALACRPQKHIASLSASCAPGLLNKTVILGVTTWVGVLWDSGYPAFYGSMSCDWPHLF